MQQALILEDNYFNLYSLSHHGAVATYPFSGKYILHHIPQKNLEERHHFFAFPAQYSTPSLAVIPFS